MKRLEMKIKETDNKINAVSLVDSPATQSNFIALSEQQEIKMQLDEEKMTVTGVILIPDQLIYRRDVQGNEFEIFATAETIEQLTYSMVQKVTLDHLTDVDSEEVRFTEIWINADSEKDKSNVIGLGEFPKGTLFGTMKVDSQEIWDKIKANELNGFSIEALMSLEEVDENQVKLDAILKILNN